MDGPRIDYERRGVGYVLKRRPDPRIAARIASALGDARTVLNVGAGAGSYEPPGRSLLAVEPSATMRSQRPIGAAPTIDARAEDLPFDDDAFDAVMACATVHHWESMEEGLAEMRRVGRCRVVVLTFDLDGLTDWQREHFAEVLAVRASQSMWGLLPAGAEDQIVERLATALSNGEWDHTYGHLRSQQELIGSVRLVISEPD